MTVPIVRGVCFYMSVGCMRGWSMGPVTVAKLGGGWLSSPPRGVGNEMSVLPLSPAVSALASFP